MANTKRVYIQEDWDEEESSGVDSSKDVAEENRRASKSKAVADDSNVIHLDNFEERESEHYETETYEPKPITVITDKGRRSVSAEELKTLIRNNEKIQQVVIEQVETKELNRVKLLFGEHGELRDEKQEVIALPGTDRVIAEEKIHTNRAIDFRDLEDNINTFKTFTGEPGANFYNVDGPGVQDVEVEEPKKKIVSTPSSQESLQVARDEEFNTLLDESVDEDEKFDIVGFRSAENKSRAKSKDSLKDFGKSLTGFKQEKNTEDKKDLPDDTEKLAGYLGGKLKEHKSKQKLTYKKSLFVRKKKKIRCAHYYKAKNHLDLFNLGNSYLYDYKEGIKNFAFSSVGVKEGQEKTVFGISSFFNYHSEIKPLIITHDFANSFYASYLGDYNREKCLTSDEKTSYEVFSLDAFDAIDFSELITLFHTLNEYEFEAFLNELIESYPLVLWDLPSLTVMDSHREIYFPMIRLIENVTIVIGANKSKINDINEMITYFNKYSVPIKGMALSHS